LRLQTESAEVFRAIEVETLDGEVRIYDAFAARLGKGDSAWVASDRLRIEEQALLQELRTRFQPMINRLPRKDRETLVTAMAEAFGLGS
jgi:DNA-directed RNA polymerase specialized sigma24 family protein